MVKNDFRGTSIFKVIIRVCMKNVELCGKKSKFLPKRYLLIFCILYWNERELNQQVCLINYVENEISNSTSHKKKRERGAKTWSNFKNVYKTPENFSLVTLVTNYYKLSLLPLVVRPWQKFEKQKLVLNFESCYCYFKWVIFS